MCRYKNNSYLCERRRERQRCKADNFVLCDHRREAWVEERCGHAQRVGQDCAATAHNTTFRDHRKGCLHKPSCCEKRMFDVVKAWAESRVQDQAEHKSTADSQKWGKEIEDVYWLHNRECGYGSKAFSDLLDEFIGDYNVDFGDRSRLRDRRQFAQIDW